MQNSTSSCDSCDLSTLERVPRKFWMRLMPGMRHYRCTACGRKQLAPKDLVESRKWVATTFKTFPANASLGAGRHPTP